MKQSLLYKPLKGPDLPTVESSWNEYATVSHELMAQSGNQRPWNKLFYFLSVSLVDLQKKVSRSRNWVSR